MKMAMRRIRFTFEGSGESATAVLLDDQAPETCEAVWAMVAEPIVQQAIHAGWVGREVSIEVPAANRVVEAAAIAKENLTLYPIPGDICFGYFPPGYGVGITEAYWDLALIYGRDTRFYFPFGAIPMALFATIDQGLDDIAKACARIRTEGAKTIRVSRVD